MCTALLRILRLAAPLALALPASASAPPGGAATRAVDWHWADLGERATAPAALALQPATGQLAVGDVHGVLIGRPGEGFQRVVLRGAVGDVAFTPDGALLAATALGLERIDSAGRRTEIAPGPGAAARAVARIAVLPELIALGTGNGLYVSRDSISWQRIAGSLPTGAATAVALQPRRGHTRCWVVIGGDLWRVELRTRNGEFEAAGSERVLIPFADGRGGVVDLVSDRDGELVVVFPQLLAVGRTARGAEDSPLRWEIVRPQLPPGGQAVRLHRGVAEVWLATNRGLLVAETLAGPWRRAAAPAGTAAVTAVVAGANEVVAVGENGLLIGTPRAIPAPLAGEDANARRAAAPPGDPAIAEVHRAALRYLGLERSRLEELRRGVRRRAWWPFLTVRGGGGWDHGRDIDHDQSFVSGETRFLTDRAVDRADAFDVTLTLAWDLGGISYDPESIDVSRETREVIELRDDVLDEITQLYFERRAVLASLSEPGTAVADAAQLRLRADAFAAGIDAWTGGWFAAQLEAATSP